MRERTRKVVVHRMYLAVLGFLLLGLPLCSYAQQLAVLYPQVREPYKQLFDTIIAGVRENYAGNVVVHELERDESEAQVLAWVRASRADAVLALGGRSAAAVAQLSPEIPVVVGAVANGAEAGQRPGVSLSPDPQQLFERLLLLQPKIKNIYIVVRQPSDMKALQQMRAAAAARQINLLEYPVDNVVELAQQYRIVTNSMDPHRDALWVAHDGKLLDGSLMEQLLEISWQRELLVFSSSLVDVKRGALFTLYPDNRAMGAQLAAMVRVAQQNPRAETTLQPVQTLLGAVNMRTADHLSLSLSSAARQRFTLTFPEGSR